MPKISPIVLRSAIVSLHPNIGVSQVACSYSIFAPRSSSRYRDNRVDSVSVPEVA